MASQVFMNNRRIGKLQRLLMGTFIMGHERDPADGSNPVLENFRSSQEQEARQDPVLHCPNPTNPPSRRERLP